MDLIFFDLSVPTSRPKRTGNIFTNPALEYVPLRVSQDQGKAEGFWDEQWSSRP